MNKRIFYFNITYGCDNKCVFCYSHNTHHNAAAFNNLSYNDFSQYLLKHKISYSDRIIINGGEPFLHPEIEPILLLLKKYGCEVLIYTNGRNLSKTKLEDYGSSFRFIIPIHGYEEIHDAITGIPGSFSETVEGLKYLLDYTQCLVDIKVILNNKMIKNDPILLKTKKILNEIPYNHAVHLTKMADTKVSKINGCKTISNESASYYMKILFDFYKNTGYKIKIFDSCLKTFSGLSEYCLKTYDKNLEVYFKDYNQYRKLVLEKDKPCCKEYCTNAIYCKSAVKGYKVLEYWNNNIYEGVE